MSKIRLEVFLSLTPQTHDSRLEELIQEIGNDFGEKVEIVVHRGAIEDGGKYNITAAPALVIEGIIKIIGLCPSRETLLSALRQAGL